VVAFLFGDYKRIAMTKPYYYNQIYFKDARKMRELPDNSVQLIVTSPPYFNIKDYSKDGYQDQLRGERQDGQIGDIADYEKYISEMLKV